MRYLRRCKFFLVVVVLSTLVEILLHFTTTSVDMSITITIRPSLWRNPCIRPSLPLNGSTPLASSNAPTQASPPNPHFAVQYLVQSCGFSSNEALRTSQRFPGLIKSSNKPDAAWKKVIMPDLSFFRDQYGFSLRQVVRLVKSNPKLSSSNPEYIKRVAERVEELGIACSSELFFEAFLAVSRVNQHTMYARLNNLRSIGFSQEEVALLISKAPFLLNHSEKQVVRKMEFLMKEAGCEKLYVIRNPFLFCCSLENRFIPRNTVRKLLMSKELPAANLKFATFARPSDVKFVEKFVEPYEHVIPGLHRAYADAGKIGGMDNLLEHLK